MSNHKEKPRNRNEKKIALIRLLMNITAALRWKEFEAISKQDLPGIASRSIFGHLTFYYRKILLPRKASPIICIQDKKEKKVWGKLNRDICDLKKFENFV